MRKFRQMYSAFLGVPFESWISPCGYFIIDRYHMVDGRYSDKYRLYCAFDRSVDVCILFDSLEYAQNYYDKRIKNIFIEGKYQLIWLN